MRAVIPCRCKAQPLELAGHISRGDVEAVRARSPTGELIAGQEPHVDFDGCGGRRKRRRVRHAGGAAVSGPRRAESLVPEHAAKAPQRIAIALVAATS